MRILRDSKLCSVNTPLAFLVGIPWKSLHQRSVIVNDFLHDDEGGCVFVHSHSGLTTVTDRRRITAPNDEAKPFFAGNLFKHVELVYT